MSHVWEEVDCPTCGEPAGKRCRTLKTKRVTDTHAARHSESFESMIADLHEMSSRFKPIPERVVYLPGDG